jgi:hypothetical protein
LFKRLKKYMQNSNGGNQDDNDDDDDDDLEYDPDFYHVEIDDTVNEDYLY